MLISADLHPSLDELLGKLTVSIKVNKFQNFSDINIYHCTNPGLRREKKKGNLPTSCTHLRMESIFIPNSEKGDFYHIFM